MGSRTQGALWQGRIGVPPRPLPAAEPSVPGRQEPGGAGSASPHPLRVAAAALRWRRARGGRGRQEECGGDVRRPLRPAPARSLPGPTLPCAPAAAPPPSAPRTAPAPVSPRANGLWPPRQEPPRSPPCCGSHAGESRRPAVPAVLFVVPPQLTSRSCCSHLKKNSVPAIQK